MITDPLALTATIVGVAALGFWLGDRYAWAAKLSATLLVIFFGALLSNLGLVVESSTVYRVISGPVTSLAIVWLLLAVDLRDLRVAGPRMLAAFGLGVAATIAGAIIAAVVFRQVFPSTGWQLAGVMTGTYSGGGLNFVAVGRAVGLPERLFAAAAASDNVLTAVWMGVTLLLPVWLGRFYPQPDGRPSDGGKESFGVSSGQRRLSAAEESDRHSRGQPPERGARSLLLPASLRAVDLALLIGLGLLVVVAAERIATVVPQVPSVLWLTSLALALGQIKAIRRLEGTLQLGTFALHLFFVVLGIASRVEEILDVGVAVFYFTAVVVGTHGLVLYSVARLARLDVETVSVASQAAVGGPSTALALALSRGQERLALPGMMVGLLGYAVGNYAGLAVAHLVRTILGG